MPLSAVWRTGMDSVFWEHCLLALLAGGATVLAYRRLGKVMDAERATP